ncbi:hypothetical protein [Deinococcus sp. DB0503]|uniref:hypothetical protein n=1 Tax=Deinococcus sp. DB0503 TaxID=2479203 RepID=UPI0018E009D2|nr:hypothetical protein [Deinococcus sp. DB0503]
MTRPDPRALIATGLPRTGREEALRLATRALPALTIRACGCTDGGRNQALIACPHCRGEGVVRA